MEKVGNNKTVKPEVALAVLERNGRWLLQLRDDQQTIIHPGHWGLFGGHLEQGEQASEAVRRELMEEINWSPQEPLSPWFRNDSGQRIVHIYRGKLNVPVEQLCLKEGQDLQLVTVKAIQSGRIWSQKLRETRPIVPGLMIVYQRWMDIKNGN